MESARKLVHELAKQRQELDRDMLRIMTMKQKCFEALEQFHPRNSYEKSQKIEFIRLLQISLVEMRNAGNVKFYTTQLLAREEEKVRGLSEMQKKLNDMGKDLRSNTENQQATTSDRRSGAERSTNRHSQWSDHDDDRYNRSSKDIHVKEEPSENYTHRNRSYNTYRNRYHHHRGRSDYYRYKESSSNYYYDKKN